MRQDVKVYTAEAGEDLLRTVQRRAKTQYASGWLIHAMSESISREGNNGMLVVYRHADARTAEDNADPSLMSPADMIAAARRGDS